MLLGQQFGLTWWLAYLVQQDQPTWESIREVVTLGPAAVAGIEHKPEAKENLRSRKAGESMSALSGQS
jgi:hypothetical protein